MDESIITRRVYKGCPISLSNSVTLVDFLELDFFDIDVILKIDLIHSFFASINCRTRVVKFQFPNELVSK